MEEKKDVPKKASFLGFSLSETFVLTIIPFIAYIYTFVYQAGYLQAFGLPLQFISITIVDMFTIGFKALGVLFVALMFIEFTSYFLPKSDVPPSFWRRIYLLLILFLFCYPLFLFGEWLPAFLYLIMLYIFAILLLFLPPLLSRKYTGTYFQKMEYMDNEEAKAKDPAKGSLLDRTKSIIGVNAVRGFAVFLASIFIVYVAGLVAAQTQEVFYIVNTSPESVVLFATNERIISAPFDSETHIISPDFFILNINSSTNLKMKFVNTSRLKIDKSLLTPMPTLVVTSTSIP